MKSAHIKKAMLVGACLLQIGLWGSCGGDADRQEVLAKLRGLGAAASPLVGMASSTDAPRTVELTVYATVPLGETATISPFEDLPASGAVIVVKASQIAIDEASITYEAHAKFQLLSFKAQVTVPDAAQFAPYGGAGQVRYGFRLNVSGDEEKMVGNFLVYPEGAPELAWQAPQIAISGPAEGAVLASKADVDLTATVSNDNQEELKLGWFVSGGEVENRRARQTKWKTPEAGQHTLIFTARGRKSRGFALQVISVTTQ